MTPIKNDAAEPNLSRAIRPSAPSFEICAIYVSILVFFLPAQPIGPHGASRRAAANPPPPATPKHPHPYQDLRKIFHQPKKTLAFQLSSI
jgi:hypothetical protein